MATMTAEPALLSAREAERRAPRGRWELVRGRVVNYMPVQREHGNVVSEIAYRVRHFLGSPDRASVGPEIGFITARHPDTVRAPDWSLMWPEEAKARREGAWIAGGPNLAVEVVSPDDTWAEVQEKVDEYLGAGTQCVWVIYPDARTVHVIRPDAPTAVLRAGDTLPGDPVLPGFSLPLDELFGMPEVSVNGAMGQ